MRVLRIAVKSDLTMKLDLHCHTTASDGLYAPREVYQQALQSGVQLLAITDHDTVAGVQSLLRGNELHRSCRLVPGVEFSCLWHKRVIHVLGLGIDPWSPEIERAVAHQQQVRIERARGIGDRLSRRGVVGAFDGAQAIAGAGAPGRPHFAEYLVAGNYCRDHNAAFKRFLGNRHMSGLDSAWPSLQQIVAWVSNSAGLAVLAHPDAYQMTRTKLQQLVVEFNGAGGVALEVPAADKPGGLAGFCEQLCRELSLRVSVGSDFHGPWDGWRQLGRTPQYADDLPVVWELFEPALHPFVASQCG